MAYNNPQNFLIAGNDEHGVNPPTPGKRTPVMPYINRQIYENEFNFAAKNAFLADCLRIGFNILDVKPNRQDASISSRVVIVNRANPSALVTFAYNAFGDGATFNSANGLEAFYSPLNVKATQSRNFSDVIYSSILLATNLNGRGVRPLDVGLLTSVNTIATLVECGFMTNFREAKLMLDPDNVNVIGRAACRGVCQYFNVQYIDIFDQTFPVLRVGSRGNFVRYLQFKLKILGYAVGNVDGVFGQNTASAVRAFQQANGLDADGIVGRRTWYKLNNLTPEATTLRRGSFGEEVRYLQQKLYSKLYPVGTIDGIFGSNTANAVKDFQSENGLVSDGIVGKNTWSAIQNEENSRPLPSEDL
ncbi:MAG: peptidoglycan-binding protein [Clostridia bacterium]|nr:peptidoglycan-binding protein [Clostridia bacterium]